MAKYRKTALVEAEQFLPPHQIPEGCYQEGTMGDVASGHGEWFLKTLEGKHPLRYADYICKGVQGERWNVEVSIFEATYELAALATDATDGATGGGEGVTEGEAMAMFAHLNCPLCAGSGHVEDAEALGGHIVALLSALDDYESDMPASVEDAAGDLAAAIQWDGEPRNQTDDGGEK